ncbi:reverse transcriptase domain-containing protein [Tanacetum coccineum]|uniref:Reverse transcriptase domain-containing protein n=1 Tax=Tanacetum coccineum TaxID=301880 RepID=A0ABQ4YBX9_9ASTR
MANTRRVWKSVRYNVFKGLDMAYWGFLGVGTTFDIFQNIHILYLQYDVLNSSGYGVLSLFLLWSLVNAGTDTPSPPTIPEVKISEDTHRHVAGAVKIEVNNFLSMLRNVASRRDLKKFLAASDI